VRRALDPLRVPNYRRFFAGQLVSLSGTWIQTVAELWLVLQLTGSAVALGLVGALQFTPMLLVGPFAGVLADRLPKRRLLITTQLWMAVPALSLLGLTLAGAVELWMVYALVLVRGIGQAVDHPTRQAFVMEMVGPSKVAGAVSLNAAIVSSARLAGPAIGGLVISAAGVAPCFALNALSFAAVVWALAGMDPAALHSAPPAKRERGQLRSGLRYVARTPRLLVPLGAMAVVGTLAFNFNVLLPVMAERDFGGDASLYGTLAAAMGAGSVAGALGNAARGGHGIGALALITLAFGGALAAVAAAPSVATAIAALVLLGAASTAFSATVNTVLQLSAKPQMRGRVMALFSVLLLGSTPIGSPIAGWIAEHGGPRAAWLVAALATLAVGAGLAWLARSPKLHLDPPGAPEHEGRWYGSTSTSTSSRASMTGRPPLRTPSSSHARRSRTARASSPPRRTSARTS
jgi:MFS family permease